MVQQFKGKLSEREIDELQTFSVLIEYNCRLKSAQLPGFNTKIEHNDLMK